MLETSKFKSETGTSPLTSKLIYSSAYLISPLRYLSGITNSTCLKQTRDFTPTTTTSHLLLPLDYPISINGIDIFSVAQDKNRIVLKFLFFHTSYPIFEQILLPLPSNTLKNLTTSHYLQASIHLLSGLLQWSSNGFPCLYICPTAVFSHINRVVKVIQLECEYFISLLETLQRPLISLRVAMRSYIFDTVIYLSSYTSNPFVLL